MKISKYNKICFFIQCPLTKRDYERLGIELLKQRGYKVSFIDLTKVLNPRYLATYKTSEKINYDEILHVEKVSDVARYFKNNQDIFAINTIKLCYHSLFFYKILKRFSIDYANFCANCIPMPPAEKENFFSRIRKLTLSKVIRKVNLVLSILGGLRPAQYILLGAEKHNAKWMNSGKSTKKIWAHALDYDLYLKYLAERPSPCVNGNYAVFLDEYLPLHPDFFLEGVVRNPYKNAKEYYDELTRIFTFLEDILKMKIVIAAHPRSQYETMPDFFKGRKTLKGKTINLVADSKVVLAHATTALNFAVLFSKPIIFLLPNGAKNGDYYKYITSYAKEFNKIPLDINSIQKKENIERELFIDCQIYNQYKNNYIKKTGTPDKFFWEIVADRIESSLS